MVRKKKFQIKIPPVVIKCIAISFLALIIGFAGYKGAVGFLIGSPYFKIKVIQYDSALTFINHRDLEKLKGKSIFHIDLESVQKKLQIKYPQLFNLRIVRRFPDQILITAKKRKPFAQTRLRSKILTIDEKGVVLSTTTKQDEKFPLVIGIQAANKRFTLGSPLRGKALLMALKIIKNFQENRMLSIYRIESIQVKNLSKINFKLSNKMEIIIDWDRLDEKLEKLAFVLSQNDINSKEIKYIDMRFKEPIVKKK